MKRAFFITSLLIIIISNIFGGEIYIRDSLYTKRIRTPLTKQAASTYYYTVWDTVNCKLYYVSKDSLSNKFTYINTVFSNGFYLTTNISDDYDRLLAIKITGKRGAEPLDYTVCAALNAESAPTWHGAVGYGDIDTIRIANMSDTIRIWIAPQTSGSSQERTMYTIEIMSDSSCKILYAQNAASPTPGGGDYVSGALGLFDIRDSLEYLRPVIDSMGTIAEVPCSLFNGTQYTTTDGTAYINRYGKRFYITIPQLLGALSADSVISIHFPDNTIPTPKQTSHYPRWIRTSTDIIGSLTRKTSSKIEIYQDPGLTNLGETASGGVYTCEIMILLQ